METSATERVTSELTEQFRGAKFDNILKCVHCGLCLDNCPTYRELGDEKDSPRGRLYLMRGLWEGELELNQDVIAPLDRCLDCRACESVCPSGVPYGELLEKTRGILLDHRKQSVKEKLARGLLLKGLFRSTAALATASQLLRIYRWTGIPKLITQNFIGRILPKKFVFSQHLLPNFSGKSFKKKYADQLVEPTGGQTPKGRVGLFSGCILDVSEAEIHEASLKLLRASGYEVVVPGDQGCCGALHVHSGDRKTARTLAEKHRNSFEPRKLDRVITNAAGCGAQLKELHHLFPEAPETEIDKWKELENRTIDLLELVASESESLDQQNWNTNEVSVFYDAPCHLMHAQGVDVNPRKLIGSRPGVKLVPLPESNWCCGSAGIYNLVQPELAGSVLQRKIDSIRDTLKKHPETKILLTANPGCLYQIRAGINQAGIPLEVMHPAVFLAGRLQS